MSIGLGTCSTGQLILQARVSNLGALGVLPGVAVDFFEGVDATGTLIGSGVTTVALLPGESTLVTFTTSAPFVETDYFGRVDGDAMSGVIVECDESNNGDLTTGAACDIVK